MAAPPNARIACVAALLALLPARPGVEPRRPAARSAAADTPPAAAVGCDSTLAARFTPPAPVLGRYEVCPDPRPPAELAAGLVFVALDPLDAFGTAGPYHRSALARLYAGRRARVAHTWTATAERFEADTLISPYPTAALDRLEPGTLVIRWLCDRSDARCARAAPRRPLALTRTAR